MTTEQPAIASGEDEAHRLRNALADQLREQGHITDDRVEAAVRTVRRDLFIPGVPLASARPVSDGCREIGVVGHGPDGLTLAETTADQIIKWSKYRLQPINFAFRPGRAQPEPRPGRYVITRPSGTLIVAWQA